VVNAKQRFEPTPQEEEPWLNIRNIEVSTFNTKAD